MPVSSAEFLPVLLTGAARIARSRQNRHPHGALDPVLAIDADLGGGAKLRVLGSSM
jgi:hypothetical protein